MDVAIRVHEEAGMGMVDTCWENDIVDVLVLVLEGVLKGKLFEARTMSNPPLAVAEARPVRVSPPPGSSAEGSTSPDS